MGKQIVTIYMAQERAFCPGIAGEWPRVIPHPTSDHGRLVKIEFPLKGNKRLLKKIEALKESTNGK